MSMLHSLSSTYGQNMIPYGQSVLSKQLCSQNLSSSNDVRLFVWVLLSPSHAFFFFFAWTGAELFLSVY